MFSIQFLLWECIESGSHNKNAPFWPILFHIVKLLLLMLFSAVRFSFPFFFLHPMLPDRQTIWVFVSAVHGDVVRIAMKVLGLKNLTHFESPRIALYVFLFYFFILSKHCLPCIIDLSVHLNDEMEKKKYRTHKIYNICLTGAVAAVYCTLCSTIVACVIKINLRFNYAYLMRVF